MKKIRSESRRRWTLDIGKIIPPRKSGSHDQTAVTAVWSGRGRLLVAATKKGMKPAVRDVATKSPRPRQNTP